MTEELRLFAYPEARILCGTTRKTVGFVYRWNNGEQQPAWIAGAVVDVTYAPLDESKPGSGSTRPRPSDAEPSGS